MQRLCAEAFVPSRPPVALGPDDVHLWFLGSDPGSAEARAWSQRLLAAYLDRAVDDLPLQRAAFGKPFLADRALEFNLSHTRGGALLAISREQPVGVDLEAGTRQRPVVELARRYFAASESRCLEGLDASRRHGAFLALWSCKEAVVKAHGRGIGFGLARLAFSLDRDGQPIALNMIDDTAGGASEWQIVALAPRADLVGALAWRGAPRPLRAFLDATDRPRGG